MSTERPVFIETAEGETLLAFVHEPTPSATEFAVVLAAGGWLGTSADRNQALVKLARRVADAGFTVVRFDYHGVGDSTGETLRFRLGSPFVDDLEAVVEWLSRRGFITVLPVGVCFGARTAVSFARSRPDAVGGLVLVSCPLDAARSGWSAGRLARRLSTREVVRRGLRIEVLRSLRDPRTRRMIRKGWWAFRWARAHPEPARADGAAVAVDDEFRAAFASLVPGTEVLHVYGPDETDEPVASLIADAAATAPSAARQQVVVTSERIQGFARLSVLDEVAAAVLEHCQQVRRARISRTAQAAGS